VLLHRLELQASRLADKYSASLAEDDRAREERCADALRCRGYLALARELLQLRNTVEPAEPPALPGCQSMKRSACYANPMEYNRLDLNVWGDYLDAVQDLQSHTPALRAMHPGVRIPDLLFRGQREADWKLETTLERYHPSSLSLAHYYTSISAARPQIEAHTGLRWEIELPNEYRKRARDSDAGLFFMGDLPAYDYMVYLRHHGFPSPLLDWTRSPYIAAFFSFRDEGDPDGRVAIYVYRETAGGLKATKRVCWANQGSACTDHTSELIVGISCNSASTPFARLSWTPDRNGTTRRTRLYSARSFAP
jgi:hypothetical protein